MKRGKKNDVVPEVQSEDVTPAPGGEAGCPFHGSRGDNDRLGEAFEVRHLFFHFFAGGVGSGADTLDAQAEFVGVGSAQKGFIERDEILAVEIEERLIEGLHAVLRAASGNGVMNQARFVGVDDAIADIAGGDHDFDGGHAALVVGAAHQALRDDRL